MSVQALALLFGEMPSIQQNNGASLVLSSTWEVTSRQSMKGSGQESVGTGKLIQKHSFTYWTTVVKLLMLMPGAKLKAAEYDSVGAYLLWLYLLKHSALPTGFPCHRLRHAQYVHTRKLHVQMHQTCNHMLSSQAPKPVEMLLYDQSHTQKPA